jgi:hypothetical protein
MQYQRSWSRKHVRAAFGWFRFYSTIKQKPHVRKISKASDARKWGAKEYSCVYDGEILHWEEIQDLYFLSQWRTQEFCLGGSTYSVEDRGQRERGSRGGSPLVRGSAQFANEWNLYSY